MASLHRVVTSSVWQRGPDGCPGYDNLRGRRQPPGDHLTSRLCSVWGALREGSAPPLFEGWLRLSWSQRGGASSGARGSPLTTPGPVCATVVSACPASRPPSSVLAQAQAPAPPTSFFIPFCLLSFSYSGASPSCLYCLSCFSSLHSSSSFPLTLATLSFLLLSPSFLFSFPFIALYFTAQ